MAKKRKKKKNTAPSSASPAKLEQRARSAIDNGNYRQAQNFYRKLIKKDADKYQPELIRVQEKLLRQLSSEKKWNDAKQVLSSLQKSAPRSPVLIAVRIQMALSKGDFENAAQLASQNISLAEKTDRENKDCIADGLVTAFEPGQKYADLPPVIGEDLNRIYSAIEDIGRKDFDAALAQIKSIGLRSLFSGWKLYIKGVCAYYRHEDEKALAAFSRLPPGTVPEKASWPFRTMMEGPQALSGTSLPSAHIHRGVCLLMGETEAAETMARAEYLWQVGRYRDSFKHVRNNLAEFPTQTPGIGHALTSFYYGAFMQLPYAKAESYLKFIVKTAVQKKGGDSFEKFKASQAMALWLEKEVEWDEDILDVWEEALSHYKALTKNGNHAEAMIYVHLGDIFSVEEPDDGPFGLFGFGPRKKRMVLRNADVAKECYQKALKADPDYRKAHLALLSLYEKTDNKSGINQALDRIIKCFPDEKDALHKAGMRCMERNSLIKGMKYLEQALSLDPIDRRLRASFITICIKAAHSYVSKDKFEKFTQMLQKAEAKSGRTSDDFLIGLSYLYARWASMLHLFKGKGKDADQMLEKALATGRDPLKLHYFTWFIGRCYDVPAKSLRKSRKVVDKAMAATPDPTVGAMLVDVLLFCKAVSKNKTPRWLDNETKSIHNYLIKAATPECSFENARTIVSYALMESTREIEIARIYIRLILERTPDNARFRWYEFLCDFSVDMHPFRIMHKTDELKKVVALAEAQGDQEILQTARKTLSIVEDILKTFEQYKNCFGEWDEDDFLDDDDDFFDDDDDDFYDDDDDIFPFDMSKLSEEEREPECSDPQEQLGLFDFPEINSPKK